MARPTKAIKRSKKYTVRLTLVESKWIEREARRHGLSISDYMRRRSLTHRLKPRLSEEEQDHYRKLVGMANNLNQLTRAVHNNEALSSQIIKTLEGELRLGKTAMIGKVSIGKSFGGVVRYVMEKAGAEEALLPRDSFINKSMTRINHEQSSFRVFQHDWGSL